MTRLLVEERRRRILELLQRQERVRVADLVRRFRVSAVTARGDLDVLAESRRIVRSHGGALRALDPPRDLPVAVKASRHHAEKVRIGRAAAHLIREGETIILDSGSTTMEVARAIGTLGLRSLTVITNALTIAIELGRCAEIRVIVLGGMVRHDALSLVGPHADEALAGLNADRLFLGVDGLDLALGLSTPDVLEARLNALMMRVSREVTVVADASKFGRRSLSVIGALDGVHRVITDRSASPQVLRKLRSRKIAVMSV